MKCEEILAALNEYVDGELEEAICDQLRGHLADCNPCKIVIDTVRQTITLYKSGKPIELPAPLREQLHGVLRKRWEAKFPPAQA